MSVVFVPFFFFGSVYAQVSLGETASNAGLYIAYFFLGFVVMAQIGGRILDKRGALLLVHDLRCDRLRQREILLEARSGD